MTDVVIQKCQREQLSEYTCLNEIDQLTGPPFKLEKASLDKAIEEKAIDVGDVCNLRNETDTKDTFCLKKDAETKLQAWASERSLLQGVPTLVGLKRDGLKEKLEKMGSGGGEPVTIADEFWGLSAADVEQYLNDPPKPFDKHEDLNNYILIKPMSSGGGFGGGQEMPIVIGDRLAAQLRVYLEDDDNILFRSGRVSGTWYIRGRVGFFSNDVGILKQCENAFFEVVTFFDNKIKELEKKAKAMDSKDEDATKVLIKEFDTLLKERGNVSEIAYRFSGVRKEAEEKAAMKRSEMMMIGIFGLPTGFAALFGLYKLWKSWRGRGKPKDPPPPPPPPPVDIEKLIRTLVEELAKRTPPVPEPIPVPEAEPVLPKFFVPIPLVLPHGASFEGWDSAKDTAVSETSVFTKLGLGVVAAASSVAAVASVADNVVGVVGDEAVAVPAAAFAWSSYLAAFGL